MISAFDTQNILESFFIQVIIFYLSLFIGITIVVFLNELWIK